MASKWKCTKTGEHCKEEEIYIFRGNFAFGSANQLSFKTTSRRDDLHSLIYLMIYLLNDCSMPGLQKILDDKSEDGNSLNKLI